MGLERQQASKGYKVVKTTDETPHNFYGFTVYAEAVIAAIGAPVDEGPDRVAYAEDEATLAGETLPPGYYPIRGSEITLSSGGVILWTE